MKILAIETSCDETAVSILDAQGDKKDATFRVLGNALLSQVDIHKEYGGVFPALAKREHAKNLVPLLASALEEAELLRESAQILSSETKERLTALLVREPELETALLAFLTTTERPEIDAIAVTHGPGLEPALWVGVNFARALADIWNIQLVPVNHMEGHLLSSLARTEGDQIAIREVSLPILVLLISGGHTELVLMDEWLSYRLIGRTRDDAVGEAFDKVARMMGLPYPGGPEISKIATAAREDSTASPFTLPRPMLDTKDCDFSFSGLKTAVMYLLKERPDISDTEKGKLAQEFEDAVAEVLWHKTHKALEETEAKTLTMGGGVSADRYLREYFTNHMNEEYPGVDLRIPERAFTTDNAIMIGIAGYYRAREKDVVDAESLTANGNLSLT